MLPEVQALINGANQGRMQLQGGMPSGMNVGGSPPNNQDPAASKWAQAFTSISSLAAVLHEQRREVEANKVAKLAVQLQHLKLEAQKKIAENAMTGSQPPSGGDAQGLHAMGVPQRA
jgi:hypothetical protein